MRGLPLLLPRHRRARRRATPKPSFFGLKLMPKKSPKMTSLFTRSDLDFNAKMDRTNLSFSMLEPIHAWFWRGPVLDPLFDRLYMPKST